MNDSNKTSDNQAELLFYDIGEYLSLEEKLSKIENFKSLNGISTDKGWEKLRPDTHHDWINQRDETFSAFISLGDKKDKNSAVIFENYSNGVKTNRDAWVYNFSKIQLKYQVQNSIDFYNSEVHRYLKESNKLVAEKFVKYDSTKFTWGRANKWDLEKGKIYSFKHESVNKAIYRPFCQKWIYFNSQLNDMVYQMPRIFPNSDAENLVICVTGRGATKDFCALISNTLPDLEMISKGQCFPFYLYNEIAPEKFKQRSLFSDDELPHRREAITDAGLKHFQKAYAAEGKNITKEDLFYYIYGLLHSPEYLKRYKDNLSKELPRIPAVKKFVDFIAFSQAGKDLANLHLNYDNEKIVKSYPVKFNLSEAEIEALQPSDYRVEQMKFIKGSEKQGANRWDKSTIIYNHKIVLKEIPAEAYDYVVNGKSAIEWVMERQSVVTHKESGIINDANDWAIDTMKDAAYPLKLLLRVITISLETMKIVHNLPKLEID